MADRTPHYLRVFLASPGDVADERGLALQVLEHIQYDPLLRGRIVLEPVAWDQPGAGVPMLATMTPQAAIAAGLPKPSECDIVVVVFWSRMGTPLPDTYRKPDGTPYLSGTEWEYLDALNAAQRDGRPAVVVYRRTEDPALKMSDPQFEEKRRQWQLVDEFFAAFRNPDGSIARGCNEYRKPEDFKQQLEVHLKSIIRPLLDKGDAGQPRPAAPAPPPPWQGSPFPGLRAFTPDDAPIFFGRGHETDELIARLADASCHALVVIGASGSGKSSLVAAGLLPRLKGNAIEGSKDWVLPQVLPAWEVGGKQWAGLRFTPGESGENPFQSLAAKLAVMLPDESMTSGKVITPGKVAERLERSPDAFAQLAGTLLEGKPAWAELLVFVDQFEELFSVVAERYREPFVAMLVAATQAARVRIVATVRADFYHLCLDWPKLAEVLCTASFPLAAAGPAALYEMVTGPAARAGLDFEKGLPARILDDTGTAPGSLALLAFALHELYEARAPDGKLTYRAYEGFGKVQGAVSKRAEGTFACLPAPAQNLLGSIFRELVEVDERGVATRRRVTRAHLASSAEAEALLDAFTDARLLVTDQSPEGAAVVEVAHEALLREWPRLKAWVADIADDLRLWRQVEAAAAEWQRRGRDSTYLWLHERLVPAQQALDQLRIDRTKLGEPVKSFIRPEAERLLDELKRPETSHYRRAEIGDRLDRIGDPRPGVGLRLDGLPDIVWCKVPDGTVNLEEVEGSFEVKPFSIAKYPVTYRQYKAFLDDADGYGNERWWEGLKHEAEPGEQYRPTSNCPAETVSWYDAVAFCRWLSARRGREVRLPTEWEWQQAATGGDAGNEYPWGPDWMDGCANTDENRLSRTTAVGMYPGGASAQGDLDLAGNVFEWCLNTRDEPRASVLTGDAPRVVRGGSWIFARDNCRCAYRYDGNPGSRDYNLGFRVCCAPPIR